MATFPLLKLPLLAQREVIGQCDPLTLIELSMLSKKCKKVLRQVKMEIENLEYAFESGQFELNICHSSDALSIKPHFYFDEPKTKEFWNIDRKDLRITRASKKSIACDRLISILVESEEHTDESKIKVLEKLTIYLLSFFKVKHFLVYVRGKVDVPNLFIWKYAKHFHNICINLFESEPADLTSDKLKFLLENLSINFLYLNVQINNDPNFKYQLQSQGSSKIRKICIQNSNWVNYDNLLNMANESISCKIQNELSQNANEIIKKWMSATNEQLEVLTLSADGRNTFVKEKVLVGINAMPSVFTIDELQKRKSWGSSLVCSQLDDAMDIRRVHDGCQATLLLTDWRIEMWVWNEKTLKAIGRM